MVKRILCAVAVVCLLAAAGYSQTVTVTANLRALTGNNVTAGAYFQFTLKAFNGNPVRMVGQGWIDTKPIIARPDAQGNIAQVLQGNDTLTSYTLNDTYYLVEVYDGGTKLYGAPFKITGQPSFNLNTQSPLTLTPPTGVLPTWWVPMAGGTMTGRLYLSGDPISPLGAATKQYVDNNGGGGGGTSVHINGSNVTTPNFGSAPAAQTGYLLSTLQVLGSNVSIEVPWGTTSSTFARGDLAVPMDGSGNATIAGSFHANSVQTTGAAPWSVTGAFGTMTAAPASNSRIGFGPSGFPLVSVNGAAPQGLALLDGSSNVVENANTATQLATAGSACSGSFATGIDAFGNALCSTATYIQLPWQTCSSVSGVAGNGLICFDQPSGTLETNINNGGWTQFVHPNLFNTNQGSANADYLEQRNGTNVQHLCVFGTYTDATHYERSCWGYDSGNARWQFWSDYGSASGGTHPFEITLGSTTPWIFDNVSGFAIRPTVDNSYDIGNSTKGVRNLYLGTAISLGGSFGTATYTICSGGASNVADYWCPGGGSGMTWPVAAGIAVYGGSAAWGTSLTAPTGAIVGTTDSQTLSNKAFGSGMTWPTFNQNTSGTAALASNLAGCIGSTAGDLCVYTGSAWARVAGNTSGTKALFEDPSGVLSFATVSGSGTVTSIGVTQTGSVFTITGTPVTTSGNINIALASGAQNLFLATPNGSSGSPTLRAIVALDIPILNQNTTGTAGGLTAPIAESQVTALVTDLGLRAFGTTTVNGHPISANVTVSASDLTTGTLPHARLPALLSADIPNNAANTTGTAGGLSANITETLVTNLVADLGAKAPLTSPTFSGTFSITGLSNGCLQVSANVVGSTGSPCGSGGGGGTWGGITGTLCNQTDLCSALASTVHLAGTESITGGKTFTTNVVMNGNLTVGGTLTLSGAGPVNFVGPYGTLPTPGTGNSGIGFGPGGAVQMNKNNGGWVSIADDTAVVHITGTESIAGLKTFSSDVTINGNLSLTGSITQTGSGPNENIFTLNSTTLTQPASGSSAWGFDITGNGGKFMLSENGSTLYSVTDALALKSPLASPTFTGTPAAPTPGSNVNTTQIPTTAWVNTYYAPKASPTFTGTPAAPTPGSNVNTTQIPTTAWVNTFYAPIASPTFTGTVTIPGGASISGFATLASPTFTGTPAAPTPGSNVNTTQIPTTAWVNTYYAPLASPTFTGTPVVPGYATTGTLVSGNYAKATGAGAVGDAGVTAGPYSLPWITALQGSSTAIAASVTSNKAKFWGVVLLAPVTTTQVTYNVGTADNTANTYDIGLYDSSGNLKAHTGATAGTTFAPSTGAKTISWTGSATLQPGKYYIAMTSNCTTSCAAFGGSSATQPTFYNAASDQSVTAGGTLNGPLSPPADIYSFGGTIPSIVAR